MATTDAWLTTDEVAVAYGVSSRTIQNWMSEDGRIPPSDIDGGRRYWRRRDVERHVKQIDKRGRWISWDRIAPKSAA